MPSLLGKTPPVTTDRDSAERHRLVRHQRDANRRTDRPCPNGHEPGLCSEAPCHATPFPARPHAPCTDRIPFPPRQPGFENLTGFTLSEKATQNGALFRGRGRVQRRRRVSDAREAAQGASGSPPGAGGSGRFCSQARMTFPTLARLAAEQLAGMSCVVCHGS